MLILTLLNYYIGLASKRETHFEQLHVDFRVGSMKSHCPACGSWLGIPSLPTPFCSVLSCWVGFRVLSCQTCSGSLVAGVGLCCIEAGWWPLAAAGKGEDGQGGRLRAVMDCGQGEHGGVTTAADDGGSPTVFITATAVPVGDTAPWRTADDGDAAGSSMSVTST